MSRTFKKRSKRTGKYKSELEKKVARALGKGTTYETEVLTYLLPKRYTPDFVAVRDSAKIYVEVKGWLRYEDQQKMRAVKLSNPELDIRMYFPKDQKVQGSKMLNSDWCTKYNFKYMIGEIPKGWPHVE